MDGTKIDVVDAPKESTEIVPDAMLVEECEITTTGAVRGLSFYLNI